MAKSSVARSAPVCPPDTILIGRFMPPRSPSTIIPTFSLQHHQLFMGLRSETGAALPYQVASSLFRSERMPCTPNTNAKSAPARYVGALGSSLDLIHRHCRCGVYPFLGRLNAQIGHWPTGRIRVLPPHAFTSSVHSISPRALRALWADDLIGTSHICISDGAGVKWRRSREGLHAEVNSLR